MYLDSGLFLTIILDYSSGRNIRIVTPGTQGSYQQFDGLGQADLHPPLWLGYLGNHYRSLETTDETSNDVPEQLSPLFDSEETVSANEFNSESTITAGEETITAWEETISADEGVIMAETEEERQNFQVCHFFSSL